MVFGEIVEPSTRALLLDDYGEYPERTKPLEWIGETRVPEKIENLIIAETSFITELMHKCIKSMNEVCKSEYAGIVIYNINYDNFIVTSNKQDIPTGEVIEKLSDWLEKAKFLYGITSCPNALFHNVKNIDIPVAFIRSLATKEVKDTLYPILESPNIVTGLGANVFSYSMYIGRPCTLFVGYTDGTPLDSVNSRPFIDLLEKLKIGTLQKCVLDFKAPPNNLYM